MPSVVPEPDALGVERSCFMVRVFRDGVDGELRRLPPWRDERPGSADSRLAVWQVFDGYLEFHVAASAVGEGAEQFGRGRINCVGGFVEEGREDEGAVCRTLL